MPLRATNALFRLDVGAACTTAAALDLFRFANPPNGVSLIIR